MKFYRLFDLREDNDITQVEIAKYLNCSQRIYSNYERGDVKIPIDVLIKLADYYKTSIDYLVGRTNEKNPYPKV